VTSVFCCNLVLFLMKKSILACAPHFSLVFFSRSEHCSSCLCFPVLRDLFPVDFSATRPTVFRLRFLRLSWPRFSCSCSLFFVLPSPPSISAGQFFVLPSPPSIPPLGFPRFLLLASFPVSVDFAVVPTVLFCRPCVSADDAACSCSRSVCRVRSGRFPLGLRTRARIPSSRGKGTPRCLFSRSTHVCNSSSCSLLARSDPIPVSRLSFWILLFGLCRP
jgi:hypothetical protein